MIKYIFCLFLVSCAHIGSTVVRSGQEQAVYVIWTKAYERTDMPPKVRWIEGKNLDCIDGIGEKGFSVPELDFLTDVVSIHCVQGFTWSPLEVLVAWQGSEISFSQTSLAHEMLHAFLLRLGVYTDQHKLPGFYEMVDKANSELVKSGL